jgi:hypothetical protein
MSDSSLSRKSVFCARNHSFRLKRLDLSMSDSRQQESILEHFVRFVENLLGEIYRTWDERPEMPKCLEINDPLLGSWKQSHHFHVPTLGCLLWQVRLLQARAIGMTETRREINERDR